MERFDERDTIFSRMTLEPGSDRYQSYYRNHPDLESVDQIFRNADPGKYADWKLENRFVDSTFSFIASLRPQVRGPVEADRQDILPTDACERLTGLAESLGASSAAAIPSDLELAYSVRGRGERHGLPVATLPAHTFVMTFEMDREETQTAPDPRQSVEVVKVYLKAAIAALSVAKWIRSLGWQAVAHIDGESELVLPPVAARAGLGEIGRHGLLVTKKYGSRVRLSAITTDMPIETSAIEPIVPGGLA